MARWPWLLLLLSGLVGGQGLSPELFRELAAVRTQLEHGQVKQALPRLRRLVEQPDLDGYASAIIQQHLGHAYLQGKNWRAASAAFAAALQPGALPEEVERDLHKTLAQLHANLGDDQTAVEHIQAWLQATPKPTPADRVLAARILHAAGRTKPAIEQLRQAISANGRPEESWQRSLLAMYLQAGWWRSAANLSRQLIQRYPDRVEYWQHLAQVEMRRGRRQQALAVAVLGYKRGALSAGQFKGWIGLYAEQGLPEQAARLLHEWRVQGRLAADRRNLTTEADLWSLAREWRRAAQVLGELSGLATDGEVDLRRGQILLRLGDWPAAGAALRQALARGGLQAPEQARQLLSWLACQDKESQGCAGAG